MLFRLSDGNNRPHIADLAYLFAVAISLFTVLYVMLIHQRYGISSAPLSAGEDKSHPKDNYKYKVDVTVNFTESINSLIEVISTQMACTVHDGELSHICASDVNNLVTMVTSKHLHDSLLQFPQLQGHFVGNKRYHSGNIPDITFNMWLEGSGTNNNNDGTNSDLTCNHIANVEHIYTKNKNININKNGTVFDLSTFVLYYLDESKQYLKAYQRKLETQNEKAWFSAIKNICLSLLSIACSLGPIEILSEAIHNVYSLIFDGKLYYHNSSISVCNVSNMVKREVTLEGDIRGICVEPQHGNSVSHLSAVTPIRVLISDYSGGHMNRSVKTKQCMYKLSFFCDSRWCDINSFKKFVGKFVELAQNTNKKLV